MIEAALLRALAPRHILFMCVANSARSQIAEGIARSLAPEGVAISSAGSEPGTIRPEAVAVLKEIGIDASEHFSKGTEQIDKDSVEAVITLCSEEVCPVFLGRATRLHWGLPDPAPKDAQPMSPEERLKLFRATRDELQLRLKLLFAQERNEDHREETDR